MTTTRGRRRGAHAGVPPRVVHRADEREAFGGRAPDLADASDDAIIRHLAIGWRSSPACRSHVEAILIDRPDRGAFARWRASVAWSLLSRTVEGRYRGWWDDRDAALELARRATMRTTAEGR